MYGWIWYGGNWHYNWNRAVLQFLRCYKCILRDSVWKMDNNMKELIKLVRPTEFLRVKSYILLLVPPFPNCIESSKNIIEIVQDSQWFTLFWGSQQHWVPQSLVSQRRYYEKGNRALREKREPLFYLGFSRREERRSCNKSKLLHLHIRNLSYQIWSGLPEEEQVWKSVPRCARYNWKLYKCKICKMLRVGHIFQSMHYVAIHTIRAFKKK